MLVVVCVVTCASDTRAYTYAYAHTHHAYTRRTHSYTRIRTHIHADNTYIHTHTHTYIHAYIHIHTTRNIILFRRLQLITLSATNYHLSDQNHRTGQAAAAAAAAAAARTGQPASQLLPSRCREPRRACVWGRARGGRDLTRTPLGPTRSIRSRAGPPP
ncbi:hypothetical protein GGS23DRAFT_510361 [Durotheca rogersii]|uniref:uncharacterized protein n=1 Tax=Durotheca rogersii TaxID=419775 RepID=UPI00222056DF|nr:uncharacterized protein GGS23DRAFT_510361 [Durotheca rogersii]KAI5863687.1 hypothetical protein GGS23DRAFT_510361 [Durotheca rogersii]